jgi:DNA topoisomerase-1
LEQALALLSLPRVVGTGVDGTQITAQNGRFGPYIKCGSESRTLPGEDDLFTVTEEAARALLAAPKTRRGAASAAPGRELGEDPATGKKVTVKSGRFGPYVTDGEVNVTLRKDDDPDTVTLQRAAELLAEKRAKGPAPKRRTAARKPAATTRAKRAAPKK